MADRQLAAAAGPFPGLAGATLLGPLANWFQIFMFGFLGVLGPSIVMYSNMDAMTDQMKASFYDTEDTFDFIVVGSGSAGAVMAHRLSEDYRVLLLEAGGEPYPGTAIPATAFIMLNRPGLDWNYLTTPQEKACFAMKKNQCIWPRGKALGGSSLLNFMAFHRGHPQDYNNWANITGDPLWKFDNVLNYFKKSENFNYDGVWDDKMRKYHAKNGPIDVSVPAYTGMGDYFVKAGREIGYPTIDYNSNFEEGFGVFQYNQKRGRRMDTYHAFLEPIRNRPSLAIYKFAHVDRVLLRNNNGNVEAYGVEYTRHGQKKQAFAKHEVVLSAGALNSPKILMLSGIGPKKHLESHGINVIKDLPVGQNLQDHVSTFLGPFVINKTVSFNMDRDINPEALTNFALDGKGPMTTTGVQATAFMSNARTKREGLGSWPNYQWVMLGTSVYNRYGSDSEFAFNIKKGLMTKYYATAKGVDSFQIISILSRPEGRGEVLLASANPADPPLMDPKYYHNREDVKNMVESVKRTVDLVEKTETFRKLGGHLLPVPFPGCKVFKFRSDDYYECFIRSISLTMYHPVGTCPMGKANSKDAVLDSRLRVIGVRNLRVADASIMPNIVSGNTNAPCIMIAELASDMIKRDWVK